MKSWVRGDVVRVVHHNFEPRAIGLVFKVERFSAGRPSVKNPWHDPDRGLRGGPFYLRFDPYWLVQANILEQLAAI